MWNKALKSNLFWDAIIVLGLLFWDAIIVLGLVFFFGWPILGMLAELAMFYIWMIVIGVALGGLLLWGCIRAMNPKRKKD